MRLLILLGIIYLCYRAVKNLMQPDAAGRKPVSNETAGEIDDIMIKDPFCEVYFPRRNSVHLKVDGKDLFFCSKECRDSFVAARSKK